MKIAPSWTLSVATYNLLADAYIKPEYYPLCAPEDFLPERRHPKLDARVAALGTDVICLQEVDEAAFARIEALLLPMGYRGERVGRPGGKPDGCATFVRAPWIIQGSLELAFAERPPKPTNRVALMTVLGLDGVSIAVVNAHLEWHPPDAPDAAKHGIFQARELTGFLDCEQSCVVCGDFNAKPDSETLAVLRRAGLVDPHPATTATFNSAGRPSKLDYILHSPDLEADAAPTSYVGPATPLPSATEPSDHVPLAAAFARKP